MNFTLDKYANLDSIIHRWDHRLKLIGLLSLIFAFASIQKLIILPAMIIVTISFYFLSRLPLSFLLTRLRYPGLFVLSIVILLPFLVGNTVILEWGILRLKQEGCLTMLLIVTRFFCILTISLILFGTAPFLQTIKSMGSLGLPRVMLDMMMLSYRYLEEFVKMLRTMQQGMKLRGFYNSGLNRRNLIILADLAGTLLVRSYDQSKRVYQAMILRGYGDSSGNFRNFWQHNLHQTDRMSWFNFAVTLCISLGFIIAEIIPL